MERHYLNFGDPRARQIAPQQNWLAKLFKVKPVSRYLCFCVTKRRARQEIGRVLKEWKRYGLEDVQIDKDRNIVFGRVALGNCKHLKKFKKITLQLMRFRFQLEGGFFCWRDLDRHRAWQEIKA